MGTKSYPNEGLYQNMRLVDDMELQSLIENGLRHYYSTLNKRATLHMHDALGRKYLPLEENFLFLMQRNKVLTIYQGPNKTQMGWGITSI